MDYEKLYKEALETGKALHKNGAYRLLMEEIFPELKESKDEKIRKELIEHCKNQAKPYIYTGNECPQIQSWIDWLEKQGEQKPINYTEEDIVEAVKNASILDMIGPKFKAGDWVVNNNSGGVYLVTEIRDDEYCLWPLDGEIMGYLRIIDVDNDYHLWNIQNAKDGDVLVDSYSKDSIIILYKGIYKERSILAHCGWNGYNLSIKTNGLGYGGLDNTNYSPATKEQRDLLFSKMKEAGYEWDEVKKELKKIVIHRWENGDIVRLKKDDGTRWQIARSNDPDFLDEWFICQIRESGIAGGYVSTYILDTNYEFVNNPINDSIKEIDKEFDKLRKTASETSWSEEDEYLLGETIQHLEELIRIDKAKHCGVDVQYYQRDINWLKSLKQRIGE